MPSTEAVFFVCDSSGPGNLKTSFPFCLATAGEIFPQSKSSREAVERLFVFQKLATSNSGIKNENPSDSASEQVRRRMEVIPAVTPRKDRTPFLISRPACTIRRLVCFHWKVMSPVISTRRLAPGPCLVIPQTTIQPLVPGLF